MLYLDADFLKDWVDAIAPLLPPVQERGALLRTAIGDDTDPKRTLIRRLESEPDARTFALNAARELANLGDLAPDRLAIEALMDAVLKQSGANATTDLRAVIEDLKRVVREKAQLRDSRPNVPALSWDDLTTGYVFISYSRANRVFVERMIADLEARGLHVWIDKIGLKPGTRNWEQALRDAIQNSRAVVLVATPNSRQSTYVQDELAIADMYGRPYYPVWAAAGASDKEWMESTAIGRGSTQFVDLRPHNYTDGIEALAAALHDAIVAASPTLSGAVSPPIAAPPMLIPPPDLARDTAETAELNEVVNPYKGLQPFTGEDADRFFGRDALVVQLIEQVRAKCMSDEARFLAIVGASGSGKSSVVMAGLLPKLQAGALPGSERWTYVTRVLPGKDPIRNLAEALYRIFPNHSMTAIDDDLNNPNGRGLHRLAGQIPHPDGHLIVYIDQFEELFTQTLSDAVRDQFIGLLVAAATESDGSALIIVTMRADFYDRPLEYLALAPLMKTPHPMLPMSLADLQEVIQRPAELPASRLTFDSGLIATLAFDVRDQAGALPLLQFTLNKLFDLRVDRGLTMDAYRRIGGIRGALANHAEDVYSRLPSQAYRDMARSLFLRLIEPGTSEQDTTRHRATLDELTLDDPAQLALLRETAEIFVNARLLVTTGGAGQETIEISHEALIRAWDRLTEWVNTARDDVRLQKAMRQNIEEWTRRGKPRGSDLLYRGTELDRLKAWEKRNLPNVAEKAFIKAAMRGTRRNLTRGVIGCYALLIGVTAGLFLLAGGVILSPALVSLPMTRQANMLDAQVRFFEANLLNGADLIHRPSDGQVITDEDPEIFRMEYAYVVVGDFVVDVIFQNPDVQADQLWDYGLVFRDQRENSQGWRLIFASDQTWQFNFSTGAAVASGTAPSMKVLPGSQNRIVLAAWDELGVVYVNDVQLTTLNLDGGYDAGDIGLASDMLLESGAQPGTVTRYFDWAIWELPEGNDGYEALSD